MTPDTHTLAAVVAASKPSDRLTLVSLADRPGVHRFFVTLEYDHFPPGTPRNDELLYVVAKWPAARPMLWIVVIVPLLTMPEVRRCAADAGMRLANGVPTLITGGAVHRFPADHSRVWTIENDPASPLYLPGGDAFIREEERRWMDAFMQTHRPRR